MIDRYSRIPKLKTSTGTQYYSTTRYPYIPPSENDIYVYTTDGDRYDTLANQYYGDSSMWWIISIANSDYSQGSIFPPRNVQLRIPGNAFDVLNSYYQENNVL